MTTSGLKGDSVQSVLRLRLILTNLILLLHECDTEKLVMELGTVQNANDIKDDSLLRMCAMMKAVEMSSKFTFGKCVGGVSDSAHERQNFDDIEGVSGGDEDEGEGDDRVMNDDPSQSQRMTIRLYHDIFDGIMINRNLDLKMPMWTKSETDDNGIVTKFSDVLHTTLTMAIPMCSKRKHCEATSAHRHQQHISIVDVELGDFKYSMRHLYDKHSMVLNPSWSKGTKSRYIDIGTPSKSACATDLARDVALTWSQHLFPRRVKVVPRRIFMLSSADNNIDASHIHSSIINERRSRSTNHSPIGTFLIGLGYDHSQPTDFKPFMTLKSSGANESSSVAWKWDEGSWIGFYNDSSVNIVTTTNPQTSNIGGFASFDIYVLEEGEECPFDDEVQEDYYISMQPPRKVPKLDEQGITPSYYTHCQQQFSLPSEEARMYFNAERCMVVDRLSYVQRPFGFLIGHQYCADCTAANSSRADVELLVHLLSKIPNSNSILLDVTTFVEGDINVTSSQSPSLQARTEPAARIAAFTPAHIRILTGENLTDENEDQINLCNRFMNRNELIPMIPFEIDKSLRLKSEIVSDAYICIQKAIIVVDSIVGAIGSDTNPPPKL